MGWQHLLGRTAAHTQVRVVCGDARCKHFIVTPGLKRKHEMNLPSGLQTQITSVPAENNITPFL